MRFSVSMTIWMRLPGTSSSARNSVSTLDFHRIRIAAKTFGLADLTDPLDVQAAAIIEEGLRAALDLHNGGVLARVSR